MFQVLRGTLTAFARELVDNFRCRRHRLLAAGHDVDLHLACDLQVIECRERLARRAPAGEQAVIVQNHGQVLRPQIGGKRVVAAGLMLVFSLYCFWGVPGNRMDRVMTAIIPNYSGGHLMVALYETGGNWPIVKDDYEAARAAS